jgi:hypothetical protein
MWEHLRTKGTMRLFQVEVAKKFWEQKKYWQDKQSFLQMDMANVYELALVDMESRGKMLYIMLENI